jgi:hypothetical protein
LLKTVVTSTATKSGGTYVSSKQFRLLTKAAIEGSAVGTEDMSDSTALSKWILPPCAESDFTAEREQPAKRSASNPMPKTAIHLLVITILSPLCKPIPEV